MKVKIICALFVCALISVATLNIYLNQQENTSLSSLALANLEALANGEGGNSGEGGDNPPGGGENSGGNENGGSGQAKYEVTEVTETVTRNEYSTPESNWSWSVELNLWLFKGNASNSTPNTINLIGTKTITFKYKCCQLGGNSECTHIACPSFS